MCPALFAETHIAGPFFSLPASDHPPRNCSARHALHCLFLELRGRLDLDDQGQGCGQENGTSHRFVAVELDCVVFSQ